jgi:hypothetical protein
MVSPCHAVDSASLACSVRTLNSDVGTQAPRCPRAKYQQGDSKHEPAYPRMGNIFCTSKYVALNRVEEDIRGADVELICCSLDDGAMV